MTSKNIMSRERAAYTTSSTKSGDAGDIYPYGFASTSGELDDAVDALSAVFQDMLRAGPDGKDHASCWREEIEKTRRRVNALEYVMIPQTAGEHQIYLHEAGRERARNSTIRLMKVKDMMLQQAIEQKRREDAEALAAAEAQAT